MRRPGAAGARAVAGGAGCARTAGGVEQRAEDEGKDEGANAEVYEKAGEHGGDQVRDCSVTQELEGQEEVGNNPGSAGHQADAGDQAQGQDGPGQDV